MTDTNRSSEKEEKTPEINPFSKENLIDRRNLLQGMSATGGAAMVASGLFPGISDASQNESAWVPEDVPYGMESRWYEEISPDTVREEYPRPQLVRDCWSNLNGVWEFSTASKDENPPIGQPLDGSILVPFHPEAPLSGIKRHEDRMWYRRTFSIPENWSVPPVTSAAGGAERVILHFERVDWEATVYVNGTQIADHNGGYDHFLVDITDHLTNGNEQEIIVGVFDPTTDGTQPVGKQRLDPDNPIDPDQGGIFHTPCSGIWDTVWIEPVSKTHIQGVDMTPDLEAESLKLTVEVNDAAGTLVEATAYEDDEEVGSVTGSPNQELIVPVSNPHYWSPEDPFLYDLSIELRRGNAAGQGNNGKRIDKVESYFGMRSLGTKKINGVLRPTLNGEFVYQNGIYDQGYWPDGIYTAPTDEALIYDLNKAKKLGFNTYRKHIKTEPRRWYYHADKLGLLVWQDIPNQHLGQPIANEEAQDQWQEEMTRIIEELNNHPSLVMWVVVNEGWGHGKENIDRINEDASLADDLDGEERWINPNSGENTMFGEYPSNEGDVVDWHVYDTLEPNPEPTEDRFAVLGENASGWVPIEGHRWGEVEHPMTPEDMVNVMLERAENQKQHMTDDGLSGVINLQTTDVAWEFQGVLTFDRKLFKPDIASEEAADQIKKANQDLIEYSKQIE